MRHNFVACKFVQDFLHVCSPKYVIRTRQSVPLYLNAALQYCSVPVSEESLPLGWYDEVFPRLIKLSNLLKNVDLVDGRLVDVNDNSTVRDERLFNRMLRFKALARAFLGHPTVQEELMKNVRVAMAGRKCSPPVCFTNPIEREPLLVNNLTKVCNYLDVSAQQRKTVRFTICPQVAQHRIFTGALEEILEGLKREMKFLDSQTPSKATFMGQQIVTTCLNFLAETACRQDEDASSWMRPKPYKSAVSPSSRKWEEVLEMFNDLIDSLRREEGLSFHVSKLKVMKEGLIQIKDVLVDRDIGFKEVQHHESLVQKKLLKTLGHSSQCLFTLVRYYLHESVRDMEVEVSGGLYEIGEKDKLCLCMGKLLTSSEEKMIWSGIKQLDRALGLFKFVWETAGMNKRLELQGHLWCVGAEPRTVTYKGNLFILHGLNAVQLKIMNNCNATIWPGILATGGQNTPLGGGFCLHSGRRQFLRVSHNWSGRVWARQGCDFDRHTGIGACQTGDCNGLLQCKGIGGKPPATVVEMTFGTPASPLHFYDVSTVDGFNLPVSMVPLVRREMMGGCGVAACEVDLNMYCPAALVVKTQEKVVGCKSPCLATGFPRFCCTGDFSGAEKCQPTVFGRLFKTVCPRAYSHPFDEKTGLKTCKAPRYVITFCPT